MFFDYANTKKKIILFAYDEEEYLANRGMYIDYNKLPFKKVTNVRELAEEMKETDYNEEYHEFYNEFCNYDNINAAKKVCDYIFKQEKVDNIKIIKGLEYNNHKENVLLFGGSLLKNGITTALKGIYKNVDFAKTP